MNEEKEDILSSEGADENISSSDTEESIIPAEESVKPTEITDEPDTTDYAELLKSDMIEISAEFSPAKELDVSDLKNPIRYGALRDLGLTPKEAYLASGGRKESEDNRSHLSSSVPRKISHQFSEIPRAELDAARELFGDLSDTQIRNLYKKVTQ